LEEWVWQCPENYLPHPKSMPPKLATAVRIYVLLYALISWSTFLALVDVVIFGNDADGSVDALSLSSEKRETSVATLE
jgi:hypothetical protein